MVREVCRWRTAMVAGSAMWLVVVVVLLPACSRDVGAVTPQQLQQRYGITNAFTGEVTTPDGPIRGTFVPVAMPDGHKGELVIPATGAAYFRDEAGLHGIALQPNATRDQLVSSPVIVSRRASAAAQPHTRSWEKELLIIGGSAGAGTAVGALTGGKKGAGIGAAAGGVGGLIYDLATRKKP